jgi:hypothetical protein
VSKLIFVRPIRPSESKQFLDWSLANQEKNSFDPAVATYPSTLVPCAYDEDGPAAYMPVQHPYVLDAYAPRPGLSAIQSAVVLREIFQFAVTKAHENGVGEILFLASDQDTVDFAEKHTAFKRVPYAVYRVKIADLEPKKET